VSPSSRPINNYTATARCNFIREYIARAVTGRGVMGKLTLLQLFEEASFLAEKLYPEN
jgi:hypothetical protein